MSSVDLLAFDIGASNGRGIIGRFDGERVTFYPILHFDNHFSMRGALAYWDLDSILHNMKSCFSKAKSMGFEPSCFGIDTWGVDYGLLNKSGQLIENPRAYRCATDAEMRAAWQKTSKKTLFDRTGIAALNLNTVYQLYRRVLENDEALQKADTLLLMPDLLGYRLTGSKMSEYTNVTTTNLMDVRTRDWSWQTMRELSIPEGLFTPMDRAGTQRGSLMPDIAAEIGVSRVPFASVGTHDTASAVAAIPGEGNFAFCSSGTWSLFGIETSEPVLTDFVFENNFSNEGTVQGGFRPLKNIMGLWIIQECRREWAQAGRDYTWDQIVSQAEGAAPLRSVLDPDYPAFFQAGGMVSKIQDYCRDTGQPVPETVGEIARCVYESLALKYRWAVLKLGQMKGKPIQSLNMTGGGIQNKLLNQMAADSTGLCVTAGPIEGAALGNILLQAMALGLIKNIGEARDIVRASVETKTYSPRHTPQWDEAYGRMINCMEAAAT